MNNYPDRNGNGARAPQPQAMARPVLHKFDVFLTGPGLPQSPIAQVNAPDLRAANLLFLAQLGGDVTPLEGIRIVRQAGGIIVPS